MEIIDIEEKLRGLKIPEVKLDSHRLAFKKWITNSKEGLPWEVPVKKNKKSLLRRMRIFFEI